MDRQSVRAALRWRGMLWGGIAVSLLIPLIAMHFTNEVDWTLYDFAMAALLLVGAAAVYEISIVRVKNRAILAFIALGTALTVVAIWLEGAIGIF